MDKTKVYVMDAEWQQELMLYLQKLGYHWKSGQEAIDIPRFLKLTDKNPEQILVLDSKNKEIAVAAISVDDNLHEILEICLTVEEFLNS